MRGLRVLLAKLASVREGEWRIAIVTFIALFLVSAAHTILETARDAHLVIWLPKHDFGVAYVAVAAFALPTAALSARMATWWRSRNLLIGVLFLAAAAALAFYALPPNRPTVIALYVTVGLIASLVFPRFWIMVGALLTVGQSRRLLGPMSAAGVVGGVLGASAAAGLVSMFSIRMLFVIAAALYALAGVVVALVPSTVVTTGAQPKTKLGTAMSAVREEPFLLRVAALVVLTAATALVIDYYFKWTVARTVAAGERGAFIARYYAVMNVATLTVQLFLGSAIVRRLGTASALVLTPFLTVFAGGATFVAGAAMLPVLLLRGADGALRSSINRLTTELVYLPISPSGRERAKPLIDGALLRVAQAVTAGGLLAAARVHALSPRIFAAIVIGLGFTWLVVAISMRRPYLGQLQQSVSTTTKNAFLSPEPIDVASAELLVTKLGDDDPQTVLAAMNTLARRGRHRLIPALILRHDDPRVLSRALEILTATDRSDWLTQANRLIGSPAEAVRIAAARALASRGRLDHEKLSVDSAPSVRGYAALHAALAGDARDLADDPRIAEVMSIDAAKLGLLAAIADAPSSPRVSALLLRLASDQGAPGAAYGELLARAAVRHHELRMIPRLLGRLVHRAGRDSIRVALVALGEPALEEVARALADTENPRNLRVHLPRTLSRFGTKWAADKLLETIEQERDGLVRYKAVRALGRLVADHGIRVDRVRVERCVRANLATHLHLRAVRSALGEAPASAEGRAATTYRLFAGMLDDKLRQSFERAFRLLKVAHPSDDIHQMHVASLGNDKRARANAGEFMDSLLARRDQQPLRELFRLVLDDLPPRELADRATTFLGTDLPRTPDDAVRVALADPDVKLATLAALYAVASGTETLADSVRKAEEKRPAIAATARLFHEGLGGAKRVFDA